MPAYLLTLLAFALQQTESSLSACVCVCVWNDCIDGCYICVYGYTGVHSSSSRPDSLTLCVRLLSKCRLLLRQT